MSQHPTHEKLAEFAWDALEGAEAEAVEMHVASCGECALRVERVRTEARRLTAALEITVPAGLSARILDAAGGSARTESKSGAAWIGVAAAALFAVTTAWAWRGMENANRRIEKLEKEIASRPVIQNGTMADADEEFRKAVEAYGRTQAEVEVGIILAGSDWSTAGDREFANHVLLAKAETVNELLFQIAHGRVDYKELASTDFFAGIDTELREKLDAASLASVLASLDNSNRIAATAVASSLTSALQSVASLDQAQKSSLQALIVEKIAWRRDFHFLPDAVQREMAARVIGGDGLLGTEISALLNSQQKARVLAYLANAEAERARYWENLKNNANKH
jgi:hypothetical protein